MFCDNVLRALPTLKWSSTTAEKAPFAVRACFMHIGTVAHFSRRLMWDVLNNTYRDKWLGRTGSVAWPPTFVRPQSFIFLRMGTLKTLVYSAEIGNDVTPRQHIFGLTNHSQPPRDFRKCYDRPLSNVAIHALINGTFWAFLLNCDFIKNKNSIVMKLSLSLFFLMDVRLGPNVKGPT